MALEPGSEKSSLLPADYHHDHPAEAPEDWGWHGEWGRASRIGGWVSAVILMLMATSTHYNEQGTLFLGIIAGLLVIALGWDIQRRRHSWRQ